MAVRRGSRWWERIDRYAVAIMGVFAAGAGLAKAFGAPTWVAVVLAGVGLGAAILKVALVGGRERAEAREQRSARLAVRPLRIRELTPGQLYELGVDHEAPEALQLLGATSSNVAYEPRDADRDLRDALTKASARNGVQLIVVTGRSKAGKSRCALEAVSATVPEGWLLAPASVIEHPKALAELAAEKLSLPGPIVLWLDDLEAWARPDGLTPKILRQMHDWQQPVIVLATVFGKGTRLAGSDAVQFQDDLRTLLARADEHPLESRPTDAEHERLRKRFGEHIAQRLRGEGLGEFLIAAPELVKRLEYGEDLIGRAIVRAAIDCRRTGYLDPIPLQWLRTLHTDYHHGPADEAHFTGGLAWATERLYSNTGLLDRTGVAASVPTTRQEIYEPYDYLVDHAHRNGEAIPPAVWDHVIQHAPAERLGTIGGFAFYAHDHERAERAFRRGDQAGDAVATYNLGVLLKQRGDLDGAEAAYRRADERGDAAAASNLGLLLQDRGDLDGAEAAYRRGDERGQAAATFNLAALLEERGDRDGAHAAYRRACELDIGISATDLGALLQARGDLDGAEAAYRRADEGGDAIAARKLGILLAERGDLEGAETAYRRGDERGDAFAAIKLGLLLAARGELVEAEAAWRRADERGNAYGAHNLAVLLHGQRDLDGAEAAYRRADERGGAEAAHALGLLLYERGELGEAEAAWRRADERSHGPAAHKLGALLHERDDLNGAEAAWRRGYERGDGASAAALGTLLHQHGDLDGAEAAYRLADEHGVGPAAHNLGILLQERGDVEGANAAFARARTRGVESTDDASDQA
ncbi:MAG TPA: tetratricopeptide repeat protein [Conexibacter sp.]|nr:tetratricopeptide repeat protein [Conexibacter sp.]